MSEYKWMLPVKQSNITNHGWIHPKAKYHCFYENFSLCGRCYQVQDFFETEIDSNEIEQNPELACKECNRIWKNIQAEI